MFRFKASLNFYNGNRRKSKREQEYLGSAVSLTGAYRTNRDEFFGYNDYEAQRRPTPSVVPVTIAQKPTKPLRQIKSTSDLIRDKNLPPNIRLEKSEVSQDPRGAQQIQTNNIRSNNNQEVKLDAQKRVEKQRLGEQKKLEKQQLQEQKKLEKQRLAEQKKREKLALKEEAIQEKLRKEREKKEAQLAKKNKKAAPQRPVANPLAQRNTNAASNSVAQGSSNPPTEQMQYSTNTLESSISKSSGPPPYTEKTKLEGAKDISGNVTYSKPEDTGSWDIISKHRENIKRNKNAGTSKPTTKQTTMDLNYKLGEGSENRENQNSEA